MTQEDDAVHPTISIERVAANARLNVSRPVFCETLTYLSVSFQAQPFQVNGICNLDWSRLCHTRNVGKFRHEPVFPHDHVGCEVAQRFQQRIAHHRLVVKSNRARY